MLDKNKIKNITQQIKLFFDSDEMLMSFTVDCSLKNRMRFIEKVIFSHNSKFIFYWRFFLSRTAFFIDYSPMKVFLYRLCGIKIGKGVFISPDVVIDVHFPKLIKIDDYVIIGYGATIFCHDFISNKYRLGKVHIGKGAVIGGYVLVACGVQIGEQANITAKTIVVRDVPAFFKQPLILKTDD
jgi:acetyltransferase-like isoleucine patch superfamily enzyme